MLRFPAALPADNAQAFLDRHWQKAPLWMPGAADLANLPVVTANEVAWLATLEDVESRLVLTEFEGSRCRYRVEDGPFEARQLEELPTSNWTLLVQDVDKHLPDFRRYFDLVPFVPDWRLDDLMISVAAPGGSVGPHVDNYDVFLVQSQGTRAWQWTTDSVPADPQASAELSLVEAFTAGEDVVAMPGDVLYLHPGTAHHGVAQDSADGELCITCSIGLRAPQLSELAENAVGARDPFYADPDLQINESRPGYISAEAVRRVDRLLAARGETSPEPEKALGRFATLTKPWLTPDVEANAAAHTDQLAVHGMARLAWSDNFIFANGHSRRLPRGGASRVESLCRERRIGGRQLREWTSGREMSGLLDWLVRIGAFDIA